MNTATWEEYELMRSTEHFLMGDAGGIGQRQLPVDTGRTGPMGSACRARRKPLGDGECVLGDFGPTSITRPRHQGADVAVERQRELAIPGGSERGQWVGTNHVQFAEGRYGLELRRPWAFVLVDLAPGS